MYSFNIKDNGPDLDIVITRAMLALAAIAAMVYRTDDNYYLNLVLSLALLLAAVFIKLIIAKFRVKKIVILAVAAIILFITTHSVSFAVILLVYGYLVKYLNQKPTVLVNKEGVTIKKLLASPVYSWGEFSNVVLKDSLLTLDFKNNKLIQVNIDEEQTSVDELSFNEFCSKLI